MKNVIKNAAFNAGATAAYIALVATSMFNAERIFGGGGEDVVLIPIAMISLFVFSAALTGFLMIGRPVLWYLDGRKKEALALLGWTLGIFFCLTVLAFLLLILYR